MTNDELEFWAEADAGRLPVYDVLKWVSWLAGLYLLLDAAWNAAWWVVRKPTDWATPLTVAWKPEPKKHSELRKRTLDLGLGSTILFAAVDRPLRIAGHVKAWAELEHEALMRRADELADRWLEELWSEPLAVAA